MAKIKKSQNSESLTISLPFWETVKRSYAFTFSSMDVVLKICSFWAIIFVYEALMGFPYMCNLSPSGCTTAKEQVSLVFVSLASISIFIAFCRYIIFKKEPKFFQVSFGKREFVYIGYCLLLVLILLVPAVLGMLGIVFAAKMLSLNENVVPLLALAAFLVLAVFASRLSLIFPAIAADDKEIRFKKSWELTQGNALKIFFGQILMVLPVYVFFAILAVASMSLGFSGYLIAAVFVLLSLAVGFFSSCLMGSYYSHIYQYFTYFYKKK